MVKSTKEANEPQEPVIPEESPFLQVKQSVDPGMLGHGVPVLPGQDFRDLTKEQKDDYFNKAENSWKSKFTNPGDKLTLSKG